MDNHFKFVPELDWVKGDYRYGAHFRAPSIEVLALKFSASMHHFVEPGLGPGRAFGLRSTAGRQVAIEQFDGYDPNLLVLFEGGHCSLSEINSALADMDVQRLDVIWIAPEAR